ncbi:MAG: DUF2061 domain-containing protein [Candidatus Aminicenantales bacterium]
MEKKTLYVSSEKRKRTVLKTISWRVVATLTTMTIVFAFTGEIVLSLGVGFVEVIAKMLLYYLHERVWHMVSWGTEKHPLSSIPVKRELEPEDMEIIKRQLRDMGYLD